MVAVLLLLLARDQSGSNQEAVHHSMLAIQGQPEAPLHPQSADCQTAAAVAAAAPAC
jgi:hypothetical protein